MKDNLAIVYNMIVNKETKTKLEIDTIDRTLKRCDRLKALYLRDKRDELVAYLNGLHIAADIVFKAIHE